MAKSFWSKRTSGSGYATTASAVSRPMSIALIAIGIIVVGSLLFGVFQGAKWSFNKLSGNDTVAINTAPKPDRSADSDTNNTATSPSPEANTPITATSSTSTTTPNTATTAPRSVASVPTTNTTTLPQTGPTSNTLVFLSILLIGYLVFRKVSLKNQ